jgi:hypothetical protein
MLRERYARSLNLDTEEEALSAGREAAAKATEEEYRALMESHRELAVKRVKGEITHSESLKLQLIRWELDRIEDARTGPIRDAMREALKPRLDLARDIRGLVQELRSAGLGSRGHGRKR